MVIRGKSTERLIRLLPMLVLHQQQVVPGIASVRRLSLI